MKPKIVLLDGYLMNPNEFSWDELRALGDCQIYERTSQEQTFDRCKEADIVLTNKVILDRSLLEKLPRLKYIGITATGTNNIDLKAAKEKGIAVTNVSAYSTASVAQHTFALLLEVVNHVGLHVTAVRNGEWEKAPDFSFWKQTPIELSGKTLGLIGYGNIGKAVAKIAESFGMKVLIYSRSHKSPSSLTLETLFRESDVISLHAPLTEQTRHLINEKTISWMKPTAILINTSRGGLIDEKALAIALREKKIFAAALDVLDTEPPLPSCPLLRLDNCHITPHMAWASRETRRRLYNGVLHNLKTYLSSAS